MTNLPHRTAPVRGHAYTVPVVRELPQPPAKTSGTQTW
jgi:hypothetical protein